MADLNQQQQRELVRDRFTRTAEVFGNAVMQTRTVEAEILAEMVAAKKSDCAVDLASGTGALALAFARHVRWIIGLDLTPAMLAVAQRAAREAEAHNVAFAIGNAVDVPFPDESLDLALSSYALHHVPEPGRVICEMSRVLKRGGRAGIIDIFAQEDPRSAEMHDRIERVRDPSHVRTLAQSEFASLFAAHHLRITGTHVEEHPATFDQWMHNAGRDPSDPEYVETRRLMEETIPDDLAAFHPRYSATSAASSGEVPGIEMVNVVVFVSAEKIA
ncbi:MAG: methyltransferase domain-containing protein [Candidatus Acidiferrales bacterium]